MSTTSKMNEMSADQLDEILRATEYAEVGVALGAAAADQDLRRAAQAELHRRLGHDYK